MGFDCAEVIDVFRVRISVKTECWMCFFNGKFNLEFIGKVVVWKFEVWWKGGV